MKALHNILFAAAMAALISAMTGCKAEKLEDQSIFNTTESALDQSLYSFPLDTFCKKNFLEPYNMQFKYRMEDILVDQQKELVPVTYDRACEMAVLTKYLWYDAYDKIVCKQSAKTADFLKKNSPRIVHLVGSRSHNTSSGTITWGYASNSVQITLQGLNTLDPSNLYRLNTYALHTMHHEFTHILHQKVVIPPEYRTISQGLYEPASWQNISDSVSLSKGFITSYASQDYTEDWAETISCYITDDPKRWDQKIQTASYDWVTVEEQKQDSISAIYQGKTETREPFHKLCDALDKTKAVNDLYNYMVNAELGKIHKDTLKKHPEMKDAIVAMYDMLKETEEFKTASYRWTINRTYVNPDSVGFFHQRTSSETDAQGNEHLVGIVVRKNIERDGDGKPLLNPDGDLIYRWEREQSGVSIINNKLEIARQWLKDNYQFDIDAMRQEIQDRSYAKNADGTFKTVPMQYLGHYQSDYFQCDGLNRYTYEFVNKLTEPDEAQPTKKLLEVLLDEINRYKKK